MAKGSLPKPPKPGQKPTEPQPVVLHVAWASRDEEWIIVPDPPRQIHVGTGEPTVRVPLYRPDGGPDVIVWLHGDEIPGLTLLDEPPAGFERGAP